MCTLIYHLPFILQSQPGETVSIISTLQTENWKQIHLPKSRVRNREGEENHNNLHLWSASPTEKSKALSDEQFNSSLQKCYEVKQKVLISLKGKSFNIWLGSYIAMHLDWIKKILFCITLRYGLLWTQWDFQGRLNYSVILLLLSCFLIPEFKPEQNNKTKQKPTKQQQQKKPQGRHLRECVWIWTHSNMTLFYTEHCDLGQET